MSGNIPPLLAGILNQLDPQTSGLLLEHLKGGTPAAKIVEALRSNGFQVGVTTIKDARKRMKGA